jgi:hypothetical protein
LERLLYVSLDAAIAVTHKGAILMKKEEKLYESQFVRNI